MYVSEKRDKLDDILVAIGEVAKLNDSRTHMLDTGRAKELTDSYKIIKRMLRGSGAKVTHKMHTPYKSTGCISVIGKDFEFSNTKWFVAVSQVASNIDIYPKVDGSIQIDFTFHGLTNPID